MSDLFTPDTPALDKLSRWAADVRDQTLDDLRARRRDLVVILNRRLEALAHARSGAGQRPIVTADDVHVLLRDLPEADGFDPRWIGAVWKAGPWKKTGEYVPSLRVACHARPIAVWALDIDP